MFVDKLVRDILDVLLSDVVTYNHTKMIKFLSGDCDFESLTVQNNINTIVVEVPKYGYDGYFTFNYKLNGCDNSVKLKGGKNIMVDREKCISIILHRLL